MRSNPCLDSTSRQPETTLEVFLRSAVSRCMQQPKSAPNCRISGIHWRVAAVLHVCKPDEQTDYPRNSLVYRAHTTTKTYNRGFEFNADSLTFGLRPKKLLQRLYFQVVSLFLRNSVHFFIEKLTLFVVWK